MITLNIIVYARLGEGSGAALALPIIRGAARAMREMATFGEAGVTARET